MSAATILLVDRNDKSYSAAMCHMTGIDAVIYRLDDSCLIYLQPDGSFRSAAGETYRLATTDR